MIQHASLNMPVTSRTIGRSRSLISHLSPKSREWICSSCQRARPSTRFSTSSSARDQHRDKPFSSKLRTALRKTKIEWKPIPIGLGIGFLGAVQFYRVRVRDKKTHQQDINVQSGETTYRDNGELQERPRKRERIRPSGPWYGS